MKLLQKFFSIRNNRTHKVVTILGIKIKFKSKKLVQRVKIENLSDEIFQLNQILENQVIAYNNLQTEFSRHVEMYNNLNEEYNSYIQAQIIDKAEADKNRGEVYRYQIDMNAFEPRTITINWIQESSKVLDVGCACGELGEKLKELKNAEVTGLEYNTQSIEIAKQTNGYKDIIQCDLNKYKYIPLNNEKFDYIVCNDVLEHIYEPQKVIEHLKQHLNDDGYFLLSIPNIAHASIKANLLLNNFDYTPIGLLDQTHIRFFTYKTVAKFLAELNLEIEACKLTHGCGINGFQPNNPYPEIPQDIREFILKDKHSSIVQYVIKCKKNVTSDLININLEKIQSELEKTTYMQGVEEYLKI